jgi:hypothetical protein
MQSPLVRACNLEAVDDDAICKDLQHANSPNGLFPNAGQFAKDASEEINTNQQNHEGNIIFVGSRVRKIIPGREHAAAQRCLESAGRKVRDHCPARHAGGDRADSAQHLHEPDELDRQQQDGFEH